MLGNVEYYIEAVIKVGDGIPSDLELCEYANNDNIYLMDGDSGEGMWLGTVVLEGSDKIADLIAEQGAEIAVEIVDHSGDEPVLDFWYEVWEGSDVLGMDLFCAGLTGETGYVTIQVTVTVGELEYSREFFRYVEEMPEDMPQNENLIVGESYVVLQPGDTYTFSYDDVYVENAPEGMEFVYGIDGMTDPWPLEELAGFEWQDNGFTVTFEEEGVYFFRVWADCALNYGIRTYVNIVVGEDTFDSANFTSGESTEQIIYLGDGLETGGMWLNNAFVTGIDYDESLPYEWSIELIDSSNEEPVAHVSFGDEWQYIWGIDMHLDGCSGETGSVTYRVTLMLAGREYTRDYTINVVELPEGMPGDELMEVETDNRMEVGERFEFRVADIVIHEDLIPEGVEGKLEYYWVDGWNAVTMPNFEWLDAEGTGEEGFAITFDNDGRVWVRVGYRFGVNYTIERNVYFTGGDGAVEDPTLTHYDGMLDTVYTGSDDTWLGWYIFDAYTPMDGEEIEWNLVRISEGEGEQALYISDLFGLDGAGMGANLRVREGLETAQEETYQLTVNIADTWTLTDTFTLTIEERPEDLPTGIDAGETFVTLNVGDEYEFLFADSAFVDGNVPEGADVRYSAAGVEWQLEWMEGFEWICDENGDRIGFRFAPTHEGRYSYYAEAFINNAYYNVQMYIVVGDGVENGDAVLYHTEDAFYTLYAGVQGAENWLSLWVLPDVWLYENDEVEWMIEPLTEGDLMLNLWMDHPWEDGFGSNLFYEMLADGEASGTEEYRITACLPGYGISENVTFEIVPQPENLPTDVEGVDSEVTLSAGESYMFRYEDWTFADGEVPEDAVIRVRVGDQFIGGGDMEGIEPDENGENGGIVWTMYEDGNYYADIIFSINNYSIVKRIEFTVGEGAALHTDRETPVVYADEAAENERIRVTNVQLYPWAFNPEQEAEWSIELVESTNETPVTTAELGDYWDWDYGCEMYVTGLTGESGCDTYEVKLVLGEHEFTRTVDVVVEAWPDTLPEDGDITGIDSYYEFNPGDVYEFRYSDLGVNNLPDGVTAYYGIDGMSDPWPLEELEGFEWTEDGFRVEFWENGRYSFAVWADIAANYGIRNVISIQVGEADTSGAAVNGNQIFTKMYYDCGDLHIGDWWLEGFELLPSDDVVWEIVRAETEYQTEEPVVDVEMNVWEDNYGVSVFALNPNRNMTGSEHYQLYCYVNGELLGEADIWILVEDMPDESELNLEMVVDNAYFELEKGDWFEFDTSMFGWSEDAVLPDNAEVLEEVWLNEQIENLRGFEWTENGFGMYVDEDATYAFDAVMLISNYVVSTRIVVVVGTGLSENFGVYYEDISFEMYRGLGRISVLNAYIHDYSPVSEEGIVWTLSVVGEIEYQPVEAFIDDSWDDNLGVRIVADQIGEECGSVTYLLTAVDGDRELVNREFTLALSELPEDIATDEDVWVDGDIDVYEIEVGDTFLYDMEFFGLNEDAVVPENQIALKELGVPEYMQEKGHIEWYESGFSVVFDEDGRYTFDARVWIGNYSVCRTITIIVGTGENPNFGVNTNFNSNTMLKHFGDLWVVDYDIHDYVPPAGCNVEWNCYLKDETQEYIPMEMYVADVWNDGLSAGFHAYQCGDEDGEVTWVITAVAGEEILIEEEITLYLVECTDELPEELTVEQEEYYLQAGETFAFTKDMYGTGDEAWDEAFRKEFGWMDNLYEQGENFSWNEDGQGFEVVFENEGRYSFDVEAYYNNYVLYRTIYIQVGESVNETTRLEIDQWYDTVYLAEENIEQTTVLMGYLCDYLIFPSDNLEWEITRADETADPVAELTVYSSEADRSFVYVDVTEVYAVGSETFTLTLRVNDVFEDSCEFTVNVEALPEGMPTTLTPEVTRYEVAQGETFELNLNCTPDSEPEGVDMRIVVGEAFDVLGLDWENAEWTDNNGILVTLHEEGEYAFRFYLKSLNYSIASEEIVVVVGGISSAEIVENSGDTVVFFGEESDNLYDQTWVADFEVHNLDCERYPVTWECYPAEGVEYVMVDMWLSACGDFGEYASFVACQVDETEGSCPWVIAARVGDEEIFRKEIELTLAALPEGMPQHGEINVESDNYELAVGDTFEFTYDMFNLYDDAVVPEVAEPRKVIGASSDLQDLESFEWTDDGFCVTFDTDGRYRFDTWIWMGNYGVSRTVTLTIGTGVHPDFAVDKNFNSTVAYKDQGDLWVVDYDIRNYTPPAGCEIEWQCDPKDDPNYEDYIPVWMEITHCENENRFVGLHAWPGGDENSEITWVVKATAGDDVLVDDEYTLTLTDLPEDVPGALEMEQNVFYLEAGETFTFSYDMYDVADEEWTDAFRKEFGWLDMMTEQGDNFQWHEDGQGFDVKLEQNGRYVFEVCAWMGNFLICENVYVQVGDGFFESSHMEHFNVCDTVYLLEDSEPVELFWGEIVDYRPFPGEDVVWTLSRVDESTDPIMEIAMSVSEYDPCFAYFELVDVYAVGSEDYILSVSVGTEFEDSYQFTLNVEELPEDIPTGLSYETEVYLEPGNVYEFCWDNVGLSEGTVPENANTGNYWFEADDDLGGAGWFEYTDNGFRVGFDRDYTYTFRIVQCINNYRLDSEVTIIVGNGGQLEVEWYDAAYDMYFGWGDMWVLDGYIQNYDPEQGGIEWVLEPVDSDGGSVEVYFGGYWDEDCGANCYARQTGEQAGWASYKLIAYVNGECVGEKEFTVTINDLPENLPAELAIECTDYQLEVDDTFTFSADMIGFGEGEIPEGAFTDHWEFRDLELENIEGFEWQENGFTVPMNEAGRYHFYAVRRINNYELQQEIRITVGEVSTENVTIDCNYAAPVLYTNCGSTWMGWWAISGYTLFDTDDVQWELERITDENSSEEPAVVLEIADWWEKRDGVNIHSHDTGEVIGTETYRLTCTVNGEQLAQTDIVVDVQACPETLPTEIGGVDSIYYIGVNDTMEFLYEDWYFADGEQPEGATVRYEAHDAESLPCLEWLENDAGFRATFIEDGTYGFRAVMKLGNYMVEKQVWIVVGNGYFASAHVNWHEDNNTMYAIEGNSHGFYGAYLNDYPLTHEDSITWNLEVTGGSELATLSLEVDENDPHGANLFVTDFTGATGTLTYTLSVGTAYGFEDSREYAIEIIEVPADLPTALSVPAESLTLGVSEDYIVDMSAVGFADGSVSDDANVGFWLNTNGADENWSEDGNTCTLAYREAGRYMLEFCANVNNYQLCTRVPVTVGDGELETNIPVVEVYAGTDYNSTWAGDVRMANFEPMDDEEIEWTVEKTYADDGVTVELGDEIHYHDDGCGLTLHWTDIGTGCGIAMFTVSVSTNYGFTASCEITVNVMETPETMPTTLKMTDLISAEIGEEIEYYFDSVYLAGGEVPENAFVNTHIWSTDQGIDQVGWIEDIHDEDGNYIGVRMGFNKPGRYFFQVAVQINNIYVVGPCRVEVGDVTTEWYQDVTELYANQTGEEDYACWGGNAEAKNYYVMPGEEFGWSVERVSGDDNVTAELRFTEDPNNVARVDLEWYNVGSECGSVTYRVTVSSSEGFTDSCDYTITVSELPEGVATELTVPQTEYTLSAGDTFEMYYSDFALNGDMPEQAYFAFGHTEDMPNCEWLEGDNPGLRIVFNDAGEYTLAAMMICGNYQLYTPITITVE